MADRDTSGTGGPNRKASDPMGRDQNISGQPSANPSNASQSNTFGQGNSMGQQNDTGRMSNDLNRNNLNRMANEATESGRQTVDAAQGRIRSLMEQQTHRAADQLGSVANALHKAAEQLSHENNGTAAHYAGQAADRVEQVADMLRNSTVDDMVGQVERFARRQPEVFVGAAFAVGFLFARFVKSSGESRFHGGTSSRMTSRYGHDDRDYGQSDIGMSGGMSGGMGRSGMSDTGTSSRGMAGGIAGSTGGTDRARTGNYATTGTAPTNTATSATAAARTRDAAELMAGGSPEPISSGSSDIGSAKPNEGKTDTATGTAKPDTAKTDAGKTNAGVPDATLGSTPATGAKPQGTLP
ncbi:hypothetical protein [Azospirillum soli]|uniref:hypothetical protein n=1 Tax=Azospirillum soli TaxID=1304799 RepID=UPI001AE0EC70|nr:hypothetical protein [Azospirillum soli]MBP2315818.1 ElaB/YqjD/DUF883 family membrane-anchored ribosome-binding protein [Azospirillum soli]